ncbi:MAG: glycosyltransferase family 4 protein [Smithellaceae bacterium]|nr:glycosyltransferase family 4 protein [Smithellaceae bacterium]
MKPRVFIAMATRILGGPGKGLIQFFRNGGLESCDPICIDYMLGNKRETDFVRAIEGAKVRIIPLRQRFAFDPGLINQALELVRQEKVNVLQSHGYKSHVLCAALHWKTGLPWVAFVHGWTSENMKMRMYHGLEKTLVPFATRVVAVSDSIRRRLVFVSGDKIRVIPNAVDPTEVEAGNSGRDVRASLAIHPQALVAGVVGRFSPEKGQTYFLRALALARERFPRLIGILVGDGPDRQTLEAEVATLGLSGAIHFIGHVTHVAEYYRAMDLVVMPSLSEGMPNVALEAMLFGKALVGTRVGGIPEVVLDGVTGLIVEPKNSDQLALAMCSLFENRALLESHGRAGRQRVLVEFSPALRTRRILDLYQEVLAVRSAM